MASQSKIRPLPLDIITHLLQFCTLPTLCRFASISILADKLVAKELDIRRRHLLDPFVKGQAAFCAKLIELSSIVSGSTTLALCSARGTFIPADLDIYVPAGKSDPWVQYLTDFEGYHVLEHNPYGEADGDYHGGIGAVTTLVCGTVHIDVVESLTLCATLPVLHFWSTIVMTFMTGTAIVSLYPHLLEECRGLLTPDRMEHVLLEPPTEGDYPGPIHTLLAKYRSRGFDIHANHLDWARQEDPTISCDGLDSPACPETVRWVGDWHTLARQFSTVDKRIGGHVSERLLATNTTVWWRGGNSCGVPCSATGTYVIPCVWTQMREMVE